MHWKSPEKNCRRTISQAVDDLGLTRTTVYQAIAVLDQELHIAETDGYGHVRLAEICEHPELSRGVGRAPTRGTTLISRSRGSSQPPKGGRERPTPPPSASQQVNFEEYLQENPDSIFFTEVQGRRGERGQRPRKKRIPVEDWQPYHLVEYFAVETLAKLAYRGHSIGKINKQALAKNIKEWMDDGGLSASVIKRMVDQFCAHPEFVRSSSVPAWRAFLYKRDVLYRQAQEREEAAQARERAEDPDYWLKSDATVDKDDPRHDPAWWLGTD